MRLTAAFVEHELRTQRRSLRFRLLAAAYLGLSSLPAFVVYGEERLGATLYGANTYAAEVLVLLPFATALLAAFLALDGIQRERLDGVWVVLTLAPISNAGYLLRRWAALLALLVPLSALPLAIAAGVATAAGTPPASWEPFLLPWLLRVLPIAVGASAVALGAGTLLDHGVAALIVLYLAMLVVPALLNGFLAPTGRVVTPPGEWLGSRDVARRFAYFRAARRSGVPSLRAFLPATEGGYDRRTAGEILGNPAAIPLAFSLASLAFAARFLRRSRPDLPPWTVREDHPLRSFLSLGNRLRQRFAPDPVPARADRLAGVAALLALLAGGAVYALREESYHGRARQRYEAEAGGRPRPTPIEVLPGAWRLRARIDGSGGVRSEVEAEMVNAGSRPVGRLAFEVNPGLALRALAASRGRAAARRTWDRLEIELDPPLAAHERRRLRLSLAGVPNETVFNFQASWNTPFARRYQRNAQRRLAADLSDLSGSWTVRRVSPRRVALAGSDLLPVPRYTPWKLSAPGDDEDTPGLEVPQERIDPQADLDFAIAAPAGLYLAESCGQARPANGGELRGRCHRPLRLWGVFGGRLVEERIGALRFAVLPQHRERARFHAPSLGPLASQVAAAWPGLTIPAPIFLETSPAFGPDPFADMGDWYLYAYDQGPTASASGAVLRLPERSLVSAERISSSRLAAELVTEALLSRREVVPTQKAAFRELLGDLALRRLGLGAADGATVAGRGWELEMMKIPILPFDRWYDRRLSARLAAAGAYLDHLAGAANVQRGVEAFLSRRGAGPGTLEELLQDLGAAGGVDLGQVYREIFAGDTLPQLSLEAVRVERGEDFRVAGVLANAGTGEAFCPVVVSTESGPVEIKVRVAAGGRTPFTLATRLAPRSLQVDPNRECFRLQPVGPTSLTVAIDLTGRGGR